MRQAILTRYLNPTNFRGSRIKASAEAGSITVSYDHALSLSDNHMAAAKALAEKWEWRGKWIGGALPSGDYAFAVDAGDGNESFEVSP